MTDTELSLAFATNKYLPLADKHNSLGLSPTIISAVIFFFSVLNTYTLSHPQQLIYNSFLSGDRRHAYASPPSVNCSAGVFVFRSTRYNILLSLVTAYNNCFASSMAIPAGAILLGHFFPRRILSCNTSFLFVIAYSSIQLSLPPEAYNFFSSPLNCKPYQLFGITILSSTVSVAGSINWILCTLWPLLVTAINFLE